MNLMPQFGFFELLLVAVVALIVVGPRDLPKLMRSAGRLVAKARNLAGEFTAAFDQMAREAEMEDLRKEIEELKKNNPVADAKRAMEDAVAPIDSELKKEDREIRDAVTKPVDKGEADAGTDNDANAGANTGADASANTGANEAAKS